MEVDNCDKETRESPAVASEATSQQEKREHTTVLSRGSDSTVLSKACQLLGELEREISEEKSICMEICKVIGQDQTNIARFHALWKCFDLRVEHQVHLKNVLENYKSVHICMGETLNLVEFWHISFSQLKRFSEPKDAGTHPLVQQLTACLRNQYKYLEALMAEIKRHQGCP